MGKKLKKILWVTFLCSNALVAFFYLMACMVPYLNAGIHPYLALLSLIFPLLFVMVASLLIYWLIRNYKWAIIYSVILLCGFKSFTVIPGFHLTAKFNTAKAPENLRILTWNLSSWGETTKGNENKLSYCMQMLQVIKNADPDIICLQEFTYSKSLNSSDSALPYLKALGFKYGYFVKTRYAPYQFKPNHLTSVAILSKYPLEDTTHVDYNDADFAEPLIAADISINKKKIRFFTTHLQSVRFDYYDYNALQSLKTPYKASLQQSRATAGKLKYAYRRRALEAETIHNKIQESPYPVILCGDFNDVPNSYTYFTAKGDLQDAFLQKGFGLGRTFRFISPTLRIDYILTDKKFEIMQYHEFKVPYSDHYPIVADIKINETD